MNLNNFILFDPLVNVRNDLPLSPGNYIVTIRDINTLPTKGCKIVTPIFRGHNLIYTGITRSKKVCVVVGTMKALGYAVRNITVTKRNTMLKERLAVK